MPGRIKRLLAVGMVWCASLMAAPARRIVVIKADGLPPDLVSRLARQTDPATGRSLLPSITHVFLEGGIQVTNFYVRGISLSAPSWAMLDTGAPLPIRGNAEYDRWTGRVYDYLNPFPFYVNYARSRRVDMPAVETLDGMGIPLLIDRFPWDARYQSVQLFQRGVRWKTLGGSLHQALHVRSPRTLFNEWQVGLEMEAGLARQTEREILQRLGDERVLYLDYYFGDFDHEAHLNNDSSAQLELMKRLDGIVGRIWAGIESSPLASETLFVLVSDHGMNSDPALYSQGYNLLRFFNSAEGGAHHVLTNRYPMTEYTLKGLDPFVSEVVTPSEAPGYLVGQANEYPTAMLDLDGNERASVYLRNSDWNAIHILLQQLDRPAVDPSVRVIQRGRLEELLNVHRAAWKQTAAELSDELAALHRRIARQKVLMDRQPRKWSKPQQESGAGQAARREQRYLEIWQEDERNYGEFLAILRRLVNLHAADLLPGKIRIQDYIPRRSMGGVNSLYDLEHYVIGSGAEDFERVDYLERLTAIRVRNSVQPGVGNRPVDFVAVRLPGKKAILLYGDPSHQALIEERRSNRGLELRYSPVSVPQPAAWIPGLPLHLWEDPELAVPGDRAQWLSDWHTEQEWLAAAHRTRYSNAVIGLYQFFDDFQLGGRGPLWTDAGDDTELLRRFALRKRNLIRPDMLVLASDHWNFNVRGFNPGGNHGSFFRVSTHSVLMLAGAGLPRGRTMDTPLDSLCFFPAILRLTDLPGNPVPAGCPVLME
ncbi:MAG: alkaline phosphatase family protein [Bryobacteraceae bacterium]